MKLISTVAFALALSGLAWILADRVALAQNVPCNPAVQTCG